MIINGKLYFTPIPKESSAVSSSEFYFVKGTRGARETHKTLYKQYDIREVDVISHNTIIVCEWPTFQQAAPPNTDNVIFDHNDILYSIKKNKAYDLELEKIWMAYPRNRKISVATFLSTYLCGHSVPTVDDVFKILDMIATNADRNVITSKILDIDISYQTVLSILHPRQIYSSSKIWGLSKHSKILGTSHSDIISLYTNNKVPEHEKEIIKDIITHPLFISRYFGKYVKSIEYLIQEPETEKKDQEISWDLEI